MERAVDDQLMEREEPRAVTIPRPLEGGSYSVESMGRFVDRLLGHERAVRAKRPSTSNRCSLDETTCQKIPAGPDPRADPGRQRADHPG